ncbi:carboxypeptidase Ss1. Metallo peptidase. MEROPS family M20D [Hymenobacter daecheongensis DSM 21074]|uniref:Carboxypeptidase Ss1. Metallo peptidase. MEROPS family M20D n=1 Tax=Hymenobacter daecheongensis DSM 21074 TaxID=1121955 RepID=A0A1M6AK88_9BACT|nr:amidohydrolase [Hymenobacter daecheongensis]SHI36886.1 carboxypeptidase Ss1. Metallo peptidase. MEROPS family M20D [Hymenobacter daecheongensis DSM 21074]
MKILYSATALLLAAAPAALAQNTALNVRIATLAAQEEPKVLAWRRDLHEHPELGNQETRTAGIIAAHLRSLGLEVQTGVARTGVVGVLRGGKPGPVVALRADMDALPITETNSLPFASKVKTTYLGQPVGVMHACGHDTHVAMLMGAAEVLSQVKKDLPGTVKFIFQPAEEGSLPGEEGGAKLMVKEGVLTNPKVDAVFGVHVNAQTEVGMLRYRPGGEMASSDRFTIKVHGKGAHGAYPWNSVDPVVTAAQIIMGLQTIVSRQVKLIDDAAVVTVGTIHAGVRYNVIPPDVEMSGTIRALNPAVQKQIWAAIQRTAKGIAESAGATAEVSIEPYVPVTYNNEPLTAQMLPTLRAVAGAANVSEQKAVTGAEDFSFYQEKVPGLFLFVGGMRKGQDPATAADHHTAGFMLDESGLTLGVKTLATLAADYLVLKH